MSATLPITGELRQVAHHINTLADRAAAGTCAPTQHSE
jgi:hypothetical protein